MRAAKNDLPVGMEIPNILTSRQAQWGDLNLAPGHIPVVEEPLEVVEFSPLADYEKATAALMA